MLFLDLTLLHKLAHDLATAPVTDALSPHKMFFSLMFRKINI